MGYYFNHVPWFPAVPGNEHNITNNISKFCVSRQIDYVAGVNTANTYDSISAREDMEHLYSPVQGGVEAPNYANTPVSNAVNDVTVAADTGDEQYYSFVGITDAERNPIRI